jgi:hypothetical protein
MTNIHVTLSLDEKAYKRARVICKKHGFILSHYVSWHLAEMPDVRKP